MTRKLLPSTTLFLFAFIILAVILSVMASTKDARASTTSDQASAPEFLENSSSGYFAQMTSDINQTPVGSYPDDFVELGGRIYFSASENVYRSELWVFDPSDGSTSLAADIHPGSGDSFARSFFIHSGKIYFRAYTPSTGYELWVYDPAAAPLRWLRTSLPEPAAAARITSPS